MDSNKLSWGRRLGFMMGGLGEAMPYNVYSLYFIFFLTEVAGVGAGIAGTISMIAVVWDGITDPIIGNYSDRCRGRLGRRRTVMSWGIIPLVISFYLMFTKVSFTGAGQVAYFILVAMVFWLGMTMWIVPFWSLTGELTDSIQEQNNLRTLVMVLEYAVVFICTSGPLWCIDYMTGKGKSVESGWHMAAILIGLVVLAGCLICIFSTKEKPLEKKDVETAAVKEDSIITTFTRLFKMRAYRILFFFLGISVIGTSYCGGNLAYIMAYVANMSTGAQTAFWTFFSFFSMLLLPFVNVFLNKFGKREVIMVICLLFAANCIVFFFVGLDSLIKMILWSILFMTANATILTYFVNLAFECSAIDEFKTGKQTTGSTVSLLSFMQKVGMAVAQWMVGIILVVVKYDAAAEVWSDGTIKGLSAAVTLIPAALMIISALLLWIYPVRKASLEKLQAALEKKRNGEEYSTEGFEHLLR